MKIVIKCTNPECGRSLGFDDSQLKNLSRVKCPICGTVIQVGSPRKPAADPVTEVKTFVDLPPSAHVTGCLVFINPPVGMPSGKYKLKTGVNIIGRRSGTSVATIQVDDPEQFLSRSHFKINVQPGKPGGILFALSDLKSANKTLLNDKPVTPGDELILKSGDIITAGKIQFRFTLEKTATGPDETNIL